LPKAALCRRLQHAEAEEEQDEEAVGNPAVVRHQPVAHHRLAADEASKQSPV